MATPPDSNRWLAPLVMIALAAQAAALALLLQPDLDASVRWGAMLGLGALLVALAAVLLLRRSILGIEQARRRAVQAEAAAAQAKAQLDAALAETQLAQSLLHEAIEAMPAGFELYDQHDRLVLCNQRMQQLRPHLPVAESLGKTYEELLREGLRQGIPSNVRPGAEEEWIAQTMAARTECGEEDLRFYPPDRWMRAHQTRTPSGNMVCVRLDISDLVAQRQALEAAQQAEQQARQLLVRALDALPMGLEIFDEQDRLVIFNRWLTALMPHIDYPGSVGSTFESMLQRSLDQKNIPEAIGHEEEWLARRLAQRGTDSMPLLRELAGNRWIKIYETKTPEGYTVAVRVDVSDLIEQQQALEDARHEASQARKLLERAVEALPVGIEIFDQQDCLLIYNQALADMYPYMNYAVSIGKTFETLLRTSVSQQFIVAARGREEEWIAERLATRRIQRGVLVQQLAGNRWVKVHETRTPEGYMVAARMDVTDLIAQQQALALAQGEAQQARALLDDAIEALPEGFALFDANDRMVICNTEFRKLYPLAQAAIQPGRSFEEMLRFGVRQRQYPDAVGREEAWLAQRMAQHRAANQAVMQQLPDGRWLQIEERRTPQGGIAGVRVDVTELVRKEQLLAAANDQLARLSTTDELTGIANRRRFDEALATEWQRGARQNDPLSLLLIDIDHFKLYNDHYGHLAGDECLRRVSRLLGEGVRRAGELVARYGGEEFVVLLPNTDIDLAQSIAQRCMDHVRAAAIPHGRSPTSDVLTLSIGVACTVPDAARQPDALVREADTALYRAKDAGRDRFRVSDGLG
ncbi:MAG TPA: PAS-domain containing protein [Burkholderiaceae bacterium]|nr:PAS-domain containing protein [Burkholderiaceae bacterium]